MTRKPTLIEHAYELAGSGHFATLDELTRRLKKEGFELVDAHLQGSKIRAELRRISRAARARDPVSPD